LPGIDLLPTFLELANVSAASVQFGLSLVPFLQDERTPFATHDFVFSEGGYSNFNEYEPNDPAQADTYSDPKNLYYPRGREVKCVHVCAARDWPFKFIVPSYALFLPPTNRRWKRRHTSTAR
jgi:hypothetical protein